MRHDCSVQGNDRSTLDKIDRDLFVLDGEAISGHGKVTEEKVLEEYEKNTYSISYRYTESSSPKL